jgi:DNA mismatch repair protein MLH1
LAATRFATSKLSTLSDFQTLSSFGFRGEALASISLVSKLELVSRIPSERIAYHQIYTNGKPTWLPHPRPQARTIGTTVTVSDLFYSVPHRQKMIRERYSEEYQRVLQVVQSYAVQFPHVTFVCRKKNSPKSSSQGNSVVDFHSGTLSTVRELQKQRSNILSASKTASTISLLGSHDCHKAANDARRQILAKLCQECTLHPIQIDNHEKFQLTGLVSDPSFSIGKTKFVMFCNNRWVESNQLKRSLETLYQEFAKSNKAILYLSIHVDPAEVDVNVHPSKQQVALLHQDEIYETIVTCVREVLENAGRTFQSIESPISSTTSKRRKRTENDSNNDQISTKESHELSTWSTPPVNKLARTQSQSQASHTKVRVTTAAPSGAIEPFLCSLQPPKTSLSASSSMSSTEIVKDHEPNCRLFEINLNQPGAFAERCTCINLVRTLPERTVLFSKVPKIVQTSCSYKSIQSLRNRFQTKHVDEKWKQRLRKEAVYVGRLSEQRILVQCGVELQSWHIEGLAQGLFQQLVLTQFGGLVRASIPSIEIAVVVGQLLELEDLLSSSSHSTCDLTHDPMSHLSVRETHQHLAQQVATCLLDHADMLREYFSIGIEMKSDSKEGSTIYLTALPEIIPNHKPHPSGLPLFLLRLATEVNWEEEKPCFWQISTELGSYYGTLQYVPDEDLRHVLFPTVCQVFMPSKHSSDYFQVVTDLTALYKAFER